jgi:hypothetical protein
MGDVACSGETSMRSTCQSSPRAPPPRTLLPPPPLHPSPPLPTQMPDVSLDNLPLFVKLHIVSFLPLVDVLGGLAVVNKRWHRLISGQRVVRRGMGGSDGEWEREPGDVLWELEWQRLQEERGGVPPVVPLGSVSAVVRAGRVRSSEWGERTGEDDAGEPPRVARTHSDDGSGARGDRRNRRREPRNLFSENARGSRRSSVPLSTYVAGRHAGDSPRGPAVRWHPEAVRQLRNYHRTSDLAQPSAPRPLLRVESAKAARVLGLPMGRSAKALRVLGVDAERRVDEAGTTSTVGARLTSVSSSVSEFEEEWSRGRFVSYQCAVREEWRRAAREAASLASWRAGRATRSRRADVAASSSTSSVDGGPPHSLTLYGDTMFTASGAFVHRWSLGSHRHSLARTFVSPLGRGQTFRSLLTAAPSGRASLGLGDQSSYTPYVVGASDGPGRDEGIHVFHGDSYRELEGAASATPLAVAANGYTGVLILSDTLRLWHLPSSSAPVATLSLPATTGGGTNVSAALLTPDARAIVGTTAGSLHSFDLTTGVRHPSLPFETGTAFSDPSQTFLTPVRQILGLDGQVAVVGGGQVALYDAREAPTSTGLRLVDRFLAHARAITTATVSGYTLAAASPDHVTLSDMRKDGVPLARLDVQGVRQVTLLTASVCVTRTPTSLACYDGRVACWEHPLQAQVPVALTTTHVALGTAPVTLFTMQAGSASPPTTPRPCIIA